MKAFYINQSRNRAYADWRQAAFSLVEIMVAVALMSVIVLGLMAMFNQTQRAFRLGMNQSDVLEGGRVATDMIVRELEQTTPGFQINGVNFAAEAENLTTQKIPGPQPPLNGTVSRTNIIHDLFFVTRENQTWTGIGYFVRSNQLVANSYAPVGSLYRFETKITAAQFGNNPILLYNSFNNARAGNPSGVSKILEGIVSFRVRAYQTNSDWITNNLVRGIPSTTNVFGTYFPNMNEASVWFYSNSIPAAVELEIGVMENQTYERYKAIPSDALRGNYFDDHAGNVHLFRQRIPIRNVDLTAYQ